MERIEIYTSKKKSLLLLLASILFVAGGIWIFLNADDLDVGRAMSPIFKKVIGIVAVLFFGLGIFFGIKRLLKSQIALIIDSSGLHIQPKTSRETTITWKDIQGFEEIKIQGTKIIIIGVKNPQQWIDKETNVLRKKAMQFNMKSYNSPLNIAAAGLDISSNELKEKLNQYLKKYASEVL